MDFKEQAEVMQLLYDLASYSDLGLIIDSEGVIVADLKGDRKEMFAETPSELLKLMVKEYGKDKYFTIKEIRLFDELTYDALIELERQQIRGQLIAGTHPLVLELEEAIKKFHKQTNIKFNINKQPIYAKEVYVEVIAEDGQRFETKLIPVEEVINEALYDWCLDHRLYWQHNIFDEETVKNKYYDKMCKPFRNYTQLFEDRLESFLNNDLGMSLEFLIKELQQELVEYHYNLVEDLMDEDNIVKQLMSEGVYFNTDGVRFSIKGE